MINPWIATVCGLVFLVSNFSHAPAADWRHEMKLVD